MDEFALDGIEVLRRKAYLEITSADEERLRRAHPTLQQHAKAIIERFYEYLLSHDHTRRMLGAPGLIERLKGLQGQYFSELTAGTYDLAYFENRLRVGETHDRVGLSPEWYLGAYNKYLEIAASVLRDALGPVEEYVQTMSSLTKIVYLDMSLAIDAYIHAAHAKLERKNLELESGNSELKKLEGAKQQLTDMIVHDLQNPLSGIMAFLRHLGDKPDGLSEGERDALGEALRRCEDLSQMILNVLQVSRADAGKLATYIEDVELGGLAKECVKGFELAARQSHKQLEVKAAATVAVRTDQSLVKRILGNLLRNALRHTPRGTRVVVTVESVMKGAEIRVADDGPGIPVEAQPHLFQRFGTPSLRKIGLHVDSGLGLAFCRAALEALGGGISVESDGRRGTTFTVRLPS